MDMLVERLKDPRFVLLLQSVALWQNPDQQGKLKVEVLEVATLGRGFDVNFFFFLFLNDYIKNRC